MGQLPKFNTENEDPNQFWGFRVIFQQIHKQNPFLLYTDNTDPISMTILEWLMKMEKIGKF